MDNLDYFYRAFRGYCEELKPNRVSNRFKHSILSQKKSVDALSMKRFECSIEEDWLIAIEKGLVYIGKAIKEDRQFIRNEGDVLPIEKIRSVSQDSITDLAKHSNYITRMPEEADDLLVPDKLLMVQRENDYFIYENRVLFTTLTYLKEFVSLRLEKINETANKYEGKTFVSKQVNVGYRSIDFTLELNEIQKEDPIAMGNKGFRQIVNRLTLVLNDILLLLRTNLMVEVSKAPPVKWPIVKTNILKINPNFKESLALFEFISSYNKDGYVIIERDYKIAPLDSHQAEAFSEIILLASFLTYQFNNGLEPSLHESFLADEKNREWIKDQELLDRIAELMAKIEKSGQEINEYLILLEDGYKIIEKRIAEAKEELRTTIEKYEAKVLQMTEEHVQEVLELNVKHERSLEQAKEDAKHEVETYKQEINAQKDAEISELKAEQRAEIDNLKNIIMEKDMQNIMLVSQVEDAEKNVKAAREKFLIVEAELLSLQLKTGNGPKAKDMSSRERFLELQEQKAILDKFFEQAWKESKQVIRKKHINAANIKKGKEKNETKKHK